ncbi:MAG: hypothetical protein J6B64_04010 [Bacilli bacterium]|nr:hypothetical protein [Bacilli bacterium]
MKNIEKNSKNNISKTGKDGYFKFITTLAVMLLILVLTYFLIGLFYTKEINLKKENIAEENEDISVDNTTIMLSQLFSQHDEEYYVLVYDFSDKLSIIPSWLSLYEGSNDTLTVYKADSSKKFNSKYIVEENSNKNANSLSELRVISPTLIKVKDNKIIQYIEGEDSIKEVFKNN